jgi:hypothetical protein
MSKTHHNNGGGVFTSERKRALEPKMATKHPPAPEKNRDESGKKACKSGRREDNHEKGPRWSWARNQMGNPSLYWTVWNIVGGDTILIPLGGPMRSN